MRGHAMVKRTRRHAMQNTRSSRRDKTVDQDGNPLEAGSQNGTRHGRNLTSAQLTQDF